MTGLSIVIPTFKREEVLVDTIRALLPLLGPSDELLLIDQTPVHEPETTEALTAWQRSGAIRWYRKRTPSQCQAMNVGALLATGPLIVFLDDDIIPSPGLLEAHRRALSDDPGLAGTCGQVLQPWHPGPLDGVRDFELGFNAAYNRSCEVLALMGANFAVRRDVLLAVGGLDENFHGATHRNESELAYRLVAHSGRLLRFVPEASVRHLHSNTGGVRGYGDKDTWGHIGSSVGDYYFAMRRLPWLRAVPYTLKRLLRHPLNRNTIRHPWLIPSLYLREIVAWFKALARVVRRPNNYIKDAASYDAEEAACPGPVTCDAQPPVLS